MSYIVFSMSCALLFDGFLLCPPMVFLIPRCFDLSGQFQIKFVIIIVCLGGFLYKLYIILFSFICLFVCVSTHGVK